MTTQTRIGVGYSHPRMRVNTETSERIYANLVRTSARTRANVCESRETSVRIPCESV